jgi:hypothetical protein
VSEWNDWAQQVASNRPLFEEFLSSGEDLSDGRHVIHFFNGGNLDGLAKALSGKGYVVSIGDDPPGVIAENFAVTDLAWSESEMKLMCDLGNEFDAEYDGWEAALVRQPRAESSGGTDE